MQHNVHVTMTPTNARIWMASPRSANISEFMPEQSDHTVKSKVLSSAVLVGKWWHACRTLTAWSAHLGWELGKGWAHSAGGALDSAWVSLVWRVLHGRRLGRTDWAWIVASQDIDPNREGCGQRGRI